MSSQPQSRSASAASSSNNQLVPAGSAEHQQNKKLSFSNNTNTNLFIPTVPLQQYEALLGVTEMFMETLRSIEAESRSHEEAIKMASEMREYVENMNGGNNNQNKKEEQHAEQNETEEEVEEAAPPLAINNINNDRSVSALTNASSITSKNNQQNEQQQDGAVGSGVGGTSATVRENLVEGGKLVKLISDAHPFPGKLWTLQNTTTNVQFIVTFTFGMSSRVDALGDTQILSGGGGGGNSGGNKSSTSQQKTFRISLYPGEVKPFLRGEAFSGYRMSLRFGPPDSGYDAASVKVLGGSNLVNRDDGILVLQNTNNNNNQPRTILDQLEEMRKLRGGYLSLEEALSTCLEVGTSFIDIEFPPQGDSISKLINNSSSCTTTTIDSYYHHYYSQQQQHQQQPLEPLIPIRWDRPERFLPLGEKAELAAGFDSRALCWVIPKASESFLFGRIGGGGGGNNNNSASLVVASRSTSPPSSLTMNSGGGVGVVSSSSSSSAWMLSAAALLASNPQTSRHIIAALRRCTLSDSTSGLYRVELCHGGIWRNVVIDSFMPCHRETRESLVARCSMPPENRRDVWGAVIEKAFAKCFGSYSALLNPTTSSNSGNSSSSSSGFDTFEALIDLTGGVVEVLDWRAKDVGVFAALQSALHRDAQRLSYEMVTVAVLVSSSAAATNQSNTLSGGSISAYNSIAPSRSASASPIPNDSNALETRSNISTTSRSMSHQQYNSNKTNNHDFMLHLGLFPGHCYRVVTSVSAENTRMILIDDLYFAYHHQQQHHHRSTGTKNNKNYYTSVSPNRNDIKQQQHDASNPIGSHLLKEVPAESALPLRGLGMWALEKEWEDHPLLSQSCRDELVRLLGLTLKTKRVQKDLQQQQTEERRYYSGTGESFAMLNKRLVWLDWRDAVHCFDGAGLLKVAPELSFYGMNLGNAGTTAASSPQHQHQQQIAKSQQISTSSSTSKKNKTDNKKQTTADFDQVAASSSASSSASSTNEEEDLVDSELHQISIIPSQQHQQPKFTPPSISIPRNILYRTTLDIRLPNRFNGALPEWMIELYIPPTAAAAAATSEENSTTQEEDTSEETSEKDEGNQQQQTRNNNKTKRSTFNKPVTVYIGLHQRDRRSVPDPFHPDRNYSAMLITVVGQSATSGVWDAVSHSHEGTYWRGRDVQLEVTLEPRAKPYYILPRRYAASSSSSSNNNNNASTGSSSSAGLLSSRYERNFLKTVATKEERERAEKEREAQLRHQQQNDTKDFVVSIIVPDGVANYTVPPGNDFANTNSQNNNNSSNISAANFAFKKPTPEVMKAVRYSPVWRFDPDQCETVDLCEYSKKLQQQPAVCAMKQTTTTTTTTTETDTQQQQQDYHDDDLSQLETNINNSHYFYQTIRSSLSVVDIKNSEASSSSVSKKKKRNNVNNNNNAVRISYNNETLDDEDLGDHANSNYQQQQQQLENNNFSQEEEEEGDLIQDATTLALNRATKKANKNRKNASSNGNALGNAKRSLFDDENEDDEFGLGQDQQQQTDENKNNASSDEEGGNNNNKHSAVSSPFLLKTVAIINRVPKNHLDW